MGDHPHEGRRAPPPASTTARPRMWAQASPLSTLCGESKEKPATGKRNQAKSDADSEAPEQRRVRGPRAARHSPCQSERTLRIIRWPTSSRERPCSDESPHLRPIPASPRNSRRGRRSLPASVSRFAGRSSGRPSWACRWSDSAPNSALASARDGPKSTVGYANGLGRARRDGLEVTSGSCRNSPRRRRRRLRQPALHERDWLRGGSGGLSRRLRRPCHLQRRVC